MVKRKPQKRGPQGKKGAKQTKILKAVVELDSSDDFSIGEMAEHRKFMEFIDLNGEGDEVVPPGTFATLIR